MSAERILGDQADAQNKNVGTHAPAADIVGTHVGTRLLTTSQQVARRDGGECRGCATCPAAGQEAQGEVGERSAQAGQAIQAERALRTVQCAGDRVSD